MADNFNTLDQATTTSAGITDGTIVNADINASAAIAQSKIATLTTDLAAKVDTTDTRLNISMLPVDHGLIGWTVPIDYAAANSLISTAGAAGVLVLTRIRRVPAATITNLHVDVAGAGSGLTNSFAALFTSAGARLGQSDDQSTAWQSAGFKTLPLAGGAVSFAGGDLYVGVWYNGTTAPALLRSGSGAGGSASPGQVSGTFNASSANTGLTTTAPPNLGSQSAINIRFWAAVS